MKKKILIVCDKNECTSFGRLSLNIAEALSTQYEVHILWLKTPRFFKSKIPENSKFVFHEVWAQSLYTGFFTFPKAIKKCVKKIALHNVFFIRPELAFLIPTIKKCGIKTSLFIHDTFAETLYPNSLKFKLINRFFIKPTIAADDFVFNSNWTKAKAIEHFGAILNKNSSTVIGCPIDFSLFSPAKNVITSQEKKDFLNCYGIKNFNSFCLNVSLDEPRKNVMTFLKIAKEKPEIAFVRIGKSSSQIQEFIQKNNLQNVFHFTELKPKELLEFYRHTDLFIYPSLLEGFGIPPLEALACGVPALCAATSALQENLQGVIPLIKDPLDVKAYKEILERVLNGENIINSEKKKEILTWCSMENFTLRVLHFFNAIV